MALMICSNCGGACQPKRTEPGSWLVEVALWLAFVLPGYVYRLWRRSKSTVQCLRCSGSSFASQASITPIAPVALRCGGKVLGERKRDGFDTVAKPFMATMCDLGVDAVAVQSGLLSSGPTYRAWFPFSESAYHVLDSGRSAGKMAFGAIAGTLVAGPLGLIAGAAMGAGKGHVVVASRGDESLVFRLTSGQLQSLATRGVLRG